MKVLNMIVDGLFTLPGAVGAREAAPACMHAPIIDSSLVSQSMTCIIKLSSPVY